MSKEFLLYRCDNPNGTAKEWAIAAAVSAEVEVRWGKAGRLSGHGTFGLDLVSRREKQKQREGYRFMGRVWLDDSGRHITHPTAQPAPVPTQLPAPTPRPTREPINIAKLLGDGPGFYFD